MVDKFPNVTLKEERDFLYQPYQCKSNPSTCKYFHANHQHPAFYARWQMTSIWVNMLCIYHVCANSDCDTRLDTCHQRISLPFVGWCVGWKSCSITHPLRHNRSRWRKQAKNLLLCFFKHFLCGSESINVKFLPCFAWWLIRIRSVHNNYII